MAGQLPASPALPSILVGSAQPKTAARDSPYLSRAALQIQHCSGSLPFYELVQVRHRRAFRAISLASLVITN